MEQTQVVVRRSRTTDLEGFETFVAGLSVPTSTRRFFTPTRRLARAHARLLLANDGTRGAWVASYGSDVVGHACWAAVTPDAAELAVVVADGAQRLGLGRRLTRAVLDDLGAVGMGRMEMVVQPDNRVVVGMIGRAWPDARPRSEAGLLTFGTPVRSAAGAPRAVA